MERKNLIHFSNIINLYVHNLLYDQSIDFLAFRIDMEINLEKFLSTENYEENIEVLNNSEISSYPTSEIRKLYLKRLIKELVQILITTRQPHYKKILKTFELDRLEIIDSISKFLNPDTYEGNIKLLNKHIKTKKLY